ncbi:Haloacid dehalogenase-like hydrolase family [Giardia lamblia P15]|uniref:Haloacid dehalogenase-like hydrolase family n=1 Tax=Giardia intestinalis (strain P15) TaxID=658858 RepID=E1F744_GIAIA|nr:Haloacid dehalogenase-like hydrolase family [Giardia lamblia P15]
MQYNSRFSHYITTTVAGSCGKGVSDGALFAASFNGPCALEQLANGVVMVSDSLNNCLRLVDLDSGSVSTLDVSGASGFQLTVMAPRGLCKIAINGINGVLLADAGHNRLVFINGETGHFEHLAGTGEAAHLDGGFLHAAFNFPHSIVSDPVNGIIYLTDTKNHCIRTLSLMTRKVKTLAGTPGVFGYKDGLNPLFNEPLGLVLTEDGNLIVCDSKNGALRYISRENGETITLVGRPSSAIVRTTCTYSYRNSIANQQYLSRRRTNVGNYTSFRFAVPYGLSFIDDILLITDAGTGRIYALDSYFEVVHCLNDLAPGLGNFDGPLRTSMFRAPAGLSKCKAGVLVADMESNCLRFIGPTSLKTRWGLTNDTRFIQDKANEETTATSEPLHTTQSFANGMHSNAELQSKTMTPGPANKPSKIADGSSVDPSDMLITLTEPSTMQYTMDKYNLGEDLSTRDGIQTPSYVKDFLDDPYPIAVFNLELYDLLLKYFLTASTPSLANKSLQKLVDKPIPARAASNLVSSTRSAPTLPHSSSRSTRESTIHVSLYGAEYSIQAIIEVCTIMSSRIFDMSTKTYCMYSKRVARYLSTFNPLIFIPRIPKDGTEQPILEHTKKGLLRGLSMAANVPVFSCNLLSEDGLRAEYLIVVGKRGTRVFVVEPKTESFVIELDISFLVDSLFLRCFNTAQLLFHCYSSEQSGADTEGIEAHKNAEYLDEWPIEKKDKGITAPINAGSKGSRLKAVKNNLATESLLNVSGTIITSDGDDNCPDAIESFDSDSTIFTAFDAVQKPHDQLTEMMSLCIETKTFSSAICGLFDYSPYHNVGECSVRIPLRTGVCGGERSVFVLPIAQAVFSKRYGIASGDSFCYEIVIYFSIVGHQVTGHHAMKISADKIKLCDYTEFRIPYMIARTPATFRSFTNKVTGVQEASELPRDVRRLEKNIILGVGCTSTGSACTGRPLRDKILEPQD